MDKPMNLCTTVIVHRMVSQKCSLSLIQTYLRVTKSLYVYAPSMNVYARMTSRNACLYLKKRNQF
jgi:hypothetical protein